VEQGLDTIERLERILCDALTFSPLIPMSVNVLSIGESEEKETIVNNTNNIIVRYAGSSTNQVKKFPPIYNKTMRFELYFNCQSYLATSAHSFSTYLLTAAKSTLVNLVPCVDGLKIEQSFYCVSEDPVGVTEESQFLYVQMWELEVQEIFPVVSLDPCVAKGDCRYIFPGKGAVTTLPLGGLFEEQTGKIFVPAYMGNNPNPEVPKTAGIRWSDDMNNTGDWVFVTDPSSVFLSDPLNSPIFLESTNGYSEDGKLLVAVKDVNTSETISEVLYIDSELKLARYALEIWRSGIYKGAISPDSVRDSTIIGTFTFGDFAAVKGSFAVLYSDPLNTSAKRQTIPGGTLIGVKSDVFIMVGSSKFYLVPQSPVGRGWIKEGTFEPVEANSIWKVGGLLS
jgi:hypothetical protein